MDSEDPQNGPNRLDKGKQIVAVDPDIYYPTNDDDDFDTDDELEMAFLEAAFDDQDMAHEGDSSIYCLDPASSASSSSYNSKKVNHFVLMGFAEKLVIKAIKENGEDNDEAILNSLLTFSVLENSPGEELGSSFELKLPSHIDEDCSDVFSDCDSSLGDAEGSVKDSVSIDRTISIMVDMGYQLEDVLISIERCGYEASIEILADYISAAEVAKAADLLDFPDRTQIAQTDRKRKAVQVIQRHKKRPERRVEGNNDSKLMTGFGVPGCNPAACYRKIPDEALGPPYFYYENVALTPKGVWAHISRFLYDIEPEFVDSIHFSAAARKRGYIHNLPIDNRQPLLPIPPKTIHEAFPDTEKWWPSWDTRTKLNCLLTCIGSAQLTDRIRERVASGNPSEDDIKFVITQCKKWNLVWDGKNRVAVLEPEDMEMLLGFPRYYTRGILTRTDRYKSLGNSFQIDTVAYHLSVLKPMYPDGMNVLSLFSGIGGAEMALYKLGIKMKNVVSIECSRENQKVVRHWWDQTEQEGNLIHYDDVRRVDNKMIDQWIDEFNGFDLVIGGSPCNNLAGGNRRTRDGLEGEHSSLFFEYYRILDYVRLSMRSRAAAHR